MTDFFITAAIIFGVIFAFLMLAGFYMTASSIFVRIASLVFYPDESGKPEESEAARILKEIERDERREAARIRREERKIEREQRKAAEIEYAEERRRNGFKTLTIREINLRKK